MDDFNTPGLIITQIKLLKSMPQLKMMKSQP